MKNIFFILLSLGLMLGFSLNAQAQAQCCKPKNTAAASVSSENTVKQEVKQENTETVKLKITGMTCAGCASHVHEVLSETEGVVDNAVEYPGDIAVIQYNPDKTNPELMMEAIEKNTSYTVELIKDKARKKS
jgi:mercuric ion binding protein